MKAKHKEESVAMKYLCALSLITCLERSKYMPIYAIILAKKLFTTTPQNNGRNVYRRMVISHGALKADLETGPIIGSFEE